MILSYLALVQLGVQRFFRPKTVDASLEPAPMQA